MALFSTTGIRGIANIDITPEFMLDLGKTFGTMVGPCKVLVARDTRTTSEMLSNSLIAGLLSTGCDVFDTGIAAGPVVNHAAQSAYDAGVMITSSHNPPEYNGAKFILKGGKEVGEKEEIEFEKILNSRKFTTVSWDKVGSYSECDSVSPYIMDALALVDLEKIKSTKFRVVADPGNGAQIDAVPRILEELGCEAIIINGENTGKFGRLPEPRPETLSELFEEVRKQKADFGVAFDCDGDRAVFCNENGEFIMGDVTGSMIAGSLAEKGDKIVTPVATSSIIDDVASTSGAEIVRTRVGAKYVSDSVISGGAVFGFEENGGCIFPKLSPGRDGSMTLITMLDLLTDYDSFSSAVSTLPKYFQLKAKVECSDDKKVSTMKRAMERAKQDGRKFSDIDGLKFFEEDGWILVRASGTEPVLRVFSEAKTESRAQELLELGKALLSD